MKRLLPVVGVVLVVALTIVSGVIHGRMSNRWSLPQGLLDAAERLEKFPKEFPGESPTDPGGGPSEANAKWVEQSSDPINENTLDALECKGYINRRYQNSLTGQIVQVAILLGPVGPIAVHTPEVCFSSRNHKQREGRQRETIDYSESASHKFWAVTFEANAPTLEADEQLADIRVYYAWSTGEQWLAPDEPRISFFGNPYLYKIQLEAFVSQQPGQRTNDPCQEFLQDFLPVAKSHLVEASDK